MRLLILLVCFMWAEEPVEPVVAESKIKELNKKSFKVATRTGITVVEFWASWNVANKLTKLDSIEVEDATVYRVNIDVNPEVTAKQNIVVVPTIVVYDDGVEFKRLQADLTFQLKIKKKDVQSIVDEILMSKF